MRRLAINELERRRILEVFAAITAGDWQRFKFLSDEPFLNEEAMLTQFEESWHKVLEAFENWEDTTTVADVGDGTRVIRIYLQNRTPEEPKIVLTLHSAAARTSIWSFYQELRPSDLYDM
jgi:hypothetical protein